MQIDITINYQAQTEEAVETAKDLHNRTGAIIGLYYDPETIARCEIGSVDSSGVHLHGPERGGFDWQAIYEANQRA